MITIEIQALAFKGLIQKNGTVEKRLIHKLKQQVYSLLEQHRKAGFILTFEPVKGDKRTLKVIHYNDTLFVCLPDFNTN
ncbi:hypothetical protein A6A19_07860 [Actinobacillus delphinicola]|uniref:Uncharacterized protein n=1 Tax=Actinobacillus delphinicola TaxID=51161 RepID=A0A448TTT2_9PAST|nr:hypothetical protein [Actinobacillus delphinicola]MDG6897889.1 hypothetical protein [Actinobacillus delphinicola]VEJ09402.1 Uncharacterised protein [Actinobacillus delphinicola]